jgi:hypothetical protein
LAATPFSGGKVSALLENTICCAVQILQDSNKQTARALKQIGRNMIALKIGDVFYP